MLTQGLLKQRLQEDVSRPSPGPLLTCPYGAAQHAPAAQCTAATARQLLAEQHPSALLPHSSLQAILSWLLVTWGSASLVSVLRSTIWRDVRTGTLAVDIAMGVCLCSTGVLGLSRSFNRVQLGLTVIVLIAYIALEVVCSSRAAEWRQLPLLILGLPAMLSMATARFAFDMPEPRRPTQTNSPGLFQQQEAALEGVKEHAAVAASGASAGASASSSTAVRLRGVGSATFGQWSASQVAASASQQQQQQQLPAAIRAAAATAAAPPGAGVVIVNEGGSTCPAGPSISFGGRSFSLAHREAPSVPSPQADAEALHALLNAMEQTSNMRVGED